MIVILGGIFLLEELLSNYLPVLIHLLELMGVIVVVIGAVSAFYKYIMSIFVKRSIQLSIPLLIT